jgi:hypothetical protein
MENSKIKKFLLSLETPALDLELVQSGKESSKVNALYKPRERTIILHNRNEAMQDEVRLLREAIHQYAHHLMVYGSHASPVPLPDPKEEISRHHGSRFNACYYRLLAVAGEKDSRLTSPPWRKDPEAVRLTDKVKGTLLPRYGALVLELGRSYSEVQELCTRKGYSFEQWLEEEAGTDPAEARRMMRLDKENISPGSGYDAMKVLLKIPKEHRQEAEKKVESGGAAPRSVEALFTTPVRNTEGEVERLQKEKKQLEQRIEKMRLRLEGLQRRLTQIGVEDE